MIEVALQTIHFYLKYFKTPMLSEIQINDNNLLDKKGSLFVTLYKNGEIRGSSGNIKEIQSSLAGEIIENTVGALSKDSRFEKVKPEEESILKIRIDLITSREILKEGGIASIDPTQNGVLVITKDYSNMAIILPNISPTLFIGADFIPVLKEKLKTKKFDEKDYIIYKITTQNINNFETK